MNPLYIRRRRGFSLIEIAIVLGVFSLLVSGIWALASVTRQRAHVTQAVQEISLTADAVRSAYGGLSSISGSMTTIMTKIIPLNAIPTELVTSATAAKTPWGGNSVFGVCAWNYGTNTTCALPNPATTAQQFFALEFSGIDAGSCSSIVSTVTPGQVTGLVDIYVNGTAAVSGATQPLPVPESWALSQCTGATNTVDFIYRLKPPLS